jgi:hypothetical protein
LRRTGQVSPATPASTPLTRSPTSTGARLGQPAEPANSAAMRRAARSRRAAPERRAAEGFSWRSASCVAESGPRISWATDRLLAERRSRACRSPGAAHAWASASWRTASRSAANWARRRGGRLGRLAALHRLTQSTSSTGATPAPNAARTGGMPHHDPRHEQDAGAQQCRPSAAPPLVRAPAARRSWEWARGPPARRSRGSSGRAPDQGAAACATRSSAAPTAARARNRPARPDGESAGGGKDAVYRGPEQWRRMRDTGLSSPSGRGTSGAGAELSDARDALGSCPATPLTLSRP